MDELDELKIILAKTFADLHGLQQNYMANVDARLSRLEHMMIEIDRAQDMISKKIEQQEKQDA
jgi:hypothetical protein